ncbi:MAG: hypothetical protein EOO53_09710 [Gammaproteobacteria bacterium]|nr:MAG: hypothetical protein EOO53_09710 [Gammaproteobacteria bacterium]
MREALVTREVKFEDFQEELLHFLARRFGSIPLAERIYKEMEKRIAESDMLALVGSPRVYLSSYGLSLGLQFLQEELRVNPQYMERA